MASELVVRRPHPALRGLVRAYYGYSERTPGPVRRRELPGGRAVLVVGATPLSVRDGDGPWNRFVSFVSGMHTVPAATGHEGAMAGLEAVLTPLGARVLLGVPMHEVTGATIDLGQVWGRAAAELTEASATAASWDERVALLERQLLRRAAEPPPALRWAYANLLRRRVRDIAAELGWSQRRLVRAFRDHVGLPPKATARVLRFERALNLLRQGSPLAEAAVTAGYADQAHLTREVRRLAGSPPARLLRDDFVQDPLRAPV